MTTAVTEGKLRVDLSGERPTVSAKELHEALEIGTLFRQWFPRMCEYGFAEGNDYEKVYQKCYSSRTGQTEVDYRISVDMAKHICMIQRTRKGMMYRQYFLELEKAWNTPEKVLARALRIADRQIRELQMRCSLLTAESKQEGTAAAGSQEEGGLPGPDPPLQVIGADHTDCKRLWDECSKVQPSACRPGNPV